MTKEIKLKEITVTALIGPKEVAAYLGIHPEQIYRLLDYDIGFPRPFRVGRLNKWRIGTIDAWLEDTRKD
jgi:predicted DNA-binding transcriptional regulator AlpA